MRATLAAAALFATAVSAGDYLSTVSTTIYSTITSCGPTVTDCPAASTVTTSKVYPLTTSIVYETKVYTITSCPPEVTKCPAHSTKEITETIAVSTTVCPVYETEAPHHYYNTTKGYKPKFTKTWKAPAEEETPCPETSATCGYEKIKTISTSYTKTITTVLPTVIYETETVPCPKPTKPANST